MTSIKSLNLSEWNPEDDSQWASGGSKLAWRTLAISIPALLCGFAVWMLWSVVTVQMLNLGFPFTKAQLFTLTAIAGLSGATLRIPSTFFIRLFGGKNTLLYTTGLLLWPAFGAAIALQDLNTPLWVFQLLALLSGIGGGNFASSMSNISFFFPRRIQGLALGLNAGLGNFGVTAIQIGVPLVITSSVFGGMYMLLQKASGTPFGKIPAGTMTYLHNAGWLCIMAVIPLLVLIRWGLVNITAPHVTPKVPSYFRVVLHISLLLGVGLFTTASGLWLMLPHDAGGLGIQLSKWIVLPAMVIATLGIMNIVLPAEARQILTRQYAIFKNTHTWVMTVIYTMTFGSFIGFSAALPLAITVVFGFVHEKGLDGVWSHAIANPNAPAAFMYAWIGPFVGAAARPVGGWLADKWGGALVTQICAVMMVGGALGAAHYLNAAYTSATPEIYFNATLATFVLLFFASGLGNGSTFRTIAMVFNREQTGPVLGWTAALAAYGSFLIPQIIGEQIEGGTPQYAMYGFAAFYVLCLFLNGWVYLRRTAKHFNP